MFVSEMFSRFLIAAFWLAVYVFPPVSGGPVASYDLCPRENAPGIDVDALAKDLSKDAQIYVLDDSQFATYTVRWSNLDKPNPNVVVLPGNEDDVSKIVKYAYQNDHPILAYNGHHGSLTTLGKMENGIAINLVQLDSLQISNDTNTVTVGGGINSNHLTQRLWTAGKQAVTGTCECVSYLGPALGGGHGWLQGHHGLISDQFTSMNVVLATGEIKTINSTSDLWWGMLGAGHNFGIVTSVTAKIYDIVHPNWAIETIVFSGDKVEAVYEAANKYIVQNGTQADDIINWSYWMNNATLDAEKPVIVMYTLQEGVDSVDPIYTQAFHDLEPLAITPQSGNYLDLGGWVGIALDSPPCQDFGFNNPRFPIYTKSYNTTAQKAAYELYASAISGVENPYYNSIFMFEDYSSAGVRALADDATAFGFREDLMLFAPLIIYNSTGAEEDAKVEALGNQLRDIIWEGTGNLELHTYVNYAFGTEGPESWYGYDASRQERLQKLKTQYDPQGKFSFYAPIL